MIPADRQTDLKQALLGVSLGIMSASRPGEDNERLHRLLLNDLSSLHSGKPHVLPSSWRGIPEKSVLLFHVDPHLLFRLGRKYRQESVIFKGTDDLAGLYSGRHVILANNPTSLELLMSGQRFDFETNRDRPIPWDGRSPVTRDKVVQMGWCREPRTLRARLLAKYPEMAKVASPTTNWKRVVALDSEGYPITGYLRNLGVSREHLLNKPVELRNVNEYGGSSGEGRVVAVVSTTDNKPASPAPPPPKKGLGGTFSRIKPGDRILLFPESDVAFEVTNVSPREVNFKTRSLAEGQILRTKQRPDLILLTQGSRTVPLRRLEIAR